MNGAMDILVHFTKSKSRSMSRIMASSPFTRTIPHPSASVPPVVAVVVAAVAAVVAASSQPLLPAQEQPWPWWCYCLRC
jgi:hypothetical protein